MAESAEHRELVRMARLAIQSRYPYMELVSDESEVPGSPVPPIIGESRPDLHGRHSSHASSFTELIAEAKTDDDLDNSHTDKQLSDFIHHLEKRDSGLLILVVSGHNADHAKTVLRFKYISDRVEKTQFAVFDTLDFWYFDESNCRWLLG